MRTKLIIPAMYEGGTFLLAAAFRAVGIDAEITPPSDARTLELGSRYTCGDECFPAKITVGDFLKALERPDVDPSRTKLFMPLADGPCRFGQYAPQLRDVLDSNGYEAVGIFSPNCESGYADIDVVGRKFLRTAWRASVAAGILDKLRLRIRPYEAEPGETDRVYRESLEAMARAIERAPVRQGPQLRAIRGALVQCRDRFRAIRREPGRDRPLVGVVGEIFCRLNAFANQELVRKVEEYGGEVWLAGFGEWVCYANAEELRMLKLRGQALSLRALVARLRWLIQERDEDALAAPFAEDFEGREEPPMAEILEASRPYLPPEGAMGEMVLNIGNAVCFARRGVDAIIDISPFTCMNGIVSEAIYPRVAADLGGLPIRSLYFDGAATDLELDLGIFIEMARAHRAARRRAGENSAGFAANTPDPVSRGVGDAVF